MTFELKSIESLADEKTVDAANRLQDLELTTTDKGFRKAVRAALYRLKLAGIVPDRKPVATRNGNAAPGGDLLRAFTTAADGAGNRLLLFLVGDPDGGASTLLQILVNDIEGVKSCTTLRIPRRDLPERLARFEAQLDSGLALTEMDPEYVRHLLAASRAKSAALKQTSPRDLLPWIKVIGDPTTDFSPAIYNRVTKAEIEADKEIDRDPGALFNLIWFEPWFFAAEDTFPWLAEMQALSVSASTGEQPDGFDDLVARVAEVLMNPAMLPLYVTRLEESAEVLWRCGKEQEAKMALAHAIALQSEAPVASIPFVHEIVQRTLGATLEMLAIQRESEQREQQ